MKSLVVLLTSGTVLAISLISVLVLGCMMILILLKFVQFSMEMVIAGGSGIP